MGSASNSRSYYLARYFRRHHKVEGWLLYGAMKLIRAVDQLQKQWSVEGSLVEIGVHHGKSAILLYLLARPHEKLLAIDVFEDQLLNLDLSGKGDEDKFIHNLDLFGGGHEHLIIYKGSSTDIDGDFVVRKLDGPVRIFSIDGGHTEEITYHDLCIANDAIDDMGVVILDDYFNEAWPGVSDGWRRFIDAHPQRLEPFAIGGNKLLLSRPTPAKRYLAALGEMMHGELDFSTSKRTSLTGSEVICFEYAKGMREMLRQEYHLQRSRYARRFPSLGARVKRLMGLG